MANAALVQCTFYGNAASNGGNASIDCSSSATIDNCIIAASIDGVGLYVDTSSSADISCTDIFGNVGGDWVGGIADLYGQAGNISLDPLFCNALAGDFTLAEASPCLPAYNPACGLIGAHGQGCSQPTSLEDGFASPGHGIELTNFPNPFNPATVIRFDLPLADQVTVKIYDVTGSLIKTLQAGPRAPGRHEIVWRGDDRHGKPVAAGVFFCLLETGSSERISRRMLLMK
jgi:hypothetical protein